MCVAEGGVGDAEGGGLAQGAGEALGAELDQALARARRGQALRYRGQLGHRVGQVGPLPVRPVHRDVGQVGQQLGAAVGGVAGGQQVRAPLDEGGGDPARLEVRVVQDRLEERDVGGDTADAELGDGAPGAAHRGGEVPAPAGQLDQHGVEMGADLGARVGGAAVQPDAGAAR